MLRGLRYPAERQRERADACARLALMALLVVGLAGCAGGSTPRPEYVGVFTGEFVDGLPLYRFPTIEVVGLRTRSRASESDTMDQ